MNRNARRLVGSAVIAMSLPMAFAEDPPGSGTSEWYMHDRGPDVIDEGKPVHIAAKIAAYLPNRLGDLLDIISFQVGVGFGVHANVHGTRALQVGIGAATGSRLGYDRGQAGIANESKAEFSLLPLNIESFHRESAGGNFREYKTSEDLPWRDQKYRDYWAVGAEVTAGIPSIGIEIHPTEIVDLLLGFFCLDFRHDDIPRKAHMEKTSLSKPDARRIKRVVIVPSRVVHSRETRMSTGHGVGVYHSRYSGESKAGMLGSGLTAGADAKAAQFLSDYCQEVGFDMLTHLLADAERVAVADMEWDVVVDPREMHELYAGKAVEKRNDDMLYLRLPNYPGLANFYKADAVLDVRLWEWGAWRQARAKNNVVGLAVQYRLIKYPENEIVFDWLVVSRDSEKMGSKIVTGLDTGTGLVASQVFEEESKQVSDVVSARLRDVMCEAQH